MNGKVFLIDDDDSVRDALTSIIVDHGLNIQSFSSAVQFLETFKSSAKSEVIVLDMKMPGMTGLELQSKLAELQVYIPIIFISGQSHKEEIIQGLKQGANDFLLKPFKFEDLLISIDKCLKLDLSYKGIKNKYDLLTPREKEVFEELVNGELLKDIAIKWNVSESVIKLHKSNVMEKMQITTLQDLTRLSLILKAPQLLLNQKDTSPQG
jgi:FixJ family two-component response regulator